MTDRITLWDELLFLKDGIKEVKKFIKDKNTENNEIRKDAKLIALELYISKKAHKSGFYGVHKSLIKFLLQNESKAMINLKYPILAELIKVYKHVSKIAEQEQEQKGEK